MAKTKFTTRLKNAVDGLHGRDGSGFIRTRSSSLYSPVFRERKYSWAKLMDSDGLFVGRRKVHDGEGGAPDQGVQLLMGVVVQSEDSTSQTKPNPFGKAALPHVPNGVWVDLRPEDDEPSTLGRHRLDRLLVLFVLPKGAAAKHRKSFDTAKRNVENAAILMPDAITLELARNTSSSKIEEELASIVRPFLKGAGRPPGDRS